MERKRFPAKKNGFVQAESQSTEILAKAIHFINECVIITDLKGNIVYTNEVTQKTYGYTATELLNQPASLLASRENSSNLEAIYQKTLNGGWRGRVMNRRKTGEEFPVDVSTSAIRDDRGEALALIAVTRDVTEQKTAEEALHHAELKIQAMQKIEAIGQLAGGIAHDFNNMLTVINGYTQMMLEARDTKEKQKKNLIQILEAGEKAKRMTQQLLAFGRRQHMKPVVMNLNHVIKDMSRLLKRVIGEDIELRTHLEADLGHVKLDQSQVEQIVMNLAINARDAMLRGGRLTIETANVELDEDYGQSHIAYIRKGRYVMFAVSDNGAGMDSEVQSRIFEPFFTTKETGKGTGLGLATVYGIVKQSNGYIWAYSEKNIGTTFKLYFPIVDEPVSSAAGEKPAQPQHYSGTEKILLVEDEESVRRVVKKLLSDCGYQVSATNNGKEALEFCRENSEQFDMLITDIVMPQLGGIELANELIPQYPEMKVMYMSGYTDKTIVKHGVLGADAAYIQKPFSINDFSRRVREILDA